MRKALILTILVVVVLVLLASPALARTGGYWTYTTNNNTMFVYEDDAGVKWYVNAFNNTGAAPTPAAAGAHDDPNTPNIDESVWRNNSSKQRAYGAISGLQKDYTAITNSTPSDYRVWPYSEGAVNGVNEPAVIYVPHYTYNGAYRITYATTDDPNARQMTATASPHKDYASTSAKCKVCHAVHGAGLNPTDTVGGVTTEKLLRTSTADACSFCHITNNFGKKVYDSVGDYDSTNSPYPAEYYRNDHWSGHVAKHRTSPYDGCASCHSTHGANIVADSAILKDDPAKGVTGIAPINDPVLGTGFGAFEAPVTNQRDFCQDCHSGVKRYLANGDAVALDTFAQLKIVFPSCAVNLTGGTCHTSVSTTMAAMHTVQLGVDASSDPNNRSHRMTTDLTNAAGDQVAWSATAWLTEGAWAEQNSCTTCHDSYKQNTDSWTKFPHLTHDYDLIDGYEEPAQQDFVCGKCHSSTGSFDDEVRDGVGKTF
jgi:hypothetical protein